MVKQQEVTGMTVYGQIAIDHIVDVNDLLRLGPVKDILHIGEDGELIFTSGSYIETEETHIPWFFGPLKTYRKDISGGKYWADEVARYGGRIRQAVTESIFVSRI